MDTHQPAKGFADVGYDEAIRRARELISLLREQAPRYLEQAETVGIEGCQIPVLMLWPASPVLAQRVEWALKIHGLA